MRNAAGIGGGAKKNAFFRVPEIGPGFVTTTSPSPVAWAGETAVISLALAIDTADAGVPPMVTDAPAANRLPEIRTGRPPPVGPVLGTIWLTTGPKLPSAKGCE